MTGVIDPAGKLFAHLPRLAMLQQGDVPAPINVEIDLSNRCSLGCEWCHFSHVHTRGPLSKRPKLANRVPGGDLMDLDLAERIVDELAAAGVASVTWTGGGEPTLHPDFDRMVAYTSKTGLQQGLYTHGGHLGLPTAGLLKWALTFVYVSLDAADAVAYKKHKGVDRFAAACAGIRKLAAAPGDATIGVGYLVTRDNWQDADKAADLVRELGADYVQFRPTILYDQEHPDTLAEDTAWLDQAIDWLDAVAVTRGGFVVADLDRFRGYRDWAGHGYPTCWWSGLQTVITPNGKVWTCVNLREHPGAELGDLSVESFADIWARRPLKTVDGSCRVSCRGHVANLTLTDVMAQREHAAFV